MKKILLLLLILSSCSSYDKYDINRYYDQKDQNKILTEIITYLLEAPSGVPANQRFEYKYRKQYESAIPRFSIVKYFISDDGIHYFYVLRPGPKIGEVRGVGGHFKMIENFQIYKFREEFVSVIMSEKDARERAAFLFDEMVKGKLKDYLGMETYIQWPNAITYYDSITFSWQMKPEFE